MNNFIKALFAFSLMCCAFMSSATERQRFRCMDDLIIHYQYFADKERQSLPDFIDGQVKILKQDFQSNMLNIEAYLQIKNAYLSTHTRSETEQKADDIKTQLLLGNEHVFKEHSCLLGVDRVEELDIQKQAELDTDYLFALRLQEEEDRRNRGGYQLVLLTQKLTDEDIAIYNKIVIGAKAIKHDSDVHTMTITFARPFYAETKRLEQKYLGQVQHQQALTLDEIVQDIQQLALRNKDIASLMPPINEVFMRIKGYWNNPVDGETCLDIREVMSNCFLLARVYGDPALEILCHILADNIMTNGGCHPGVTGRLAHTFFIDVSASISLGL